MKIKSIRVGISSDHSSTSYTFLAIDQPLSKSQQKTIANISRREKITSRKGTFFYGGESDMPHSWESLMNDYYDVMYYESYGWWILAIAFEASEKQFKTLEAYKFDGVEDCGINLERSGNRVLISINCQIDPSDVIEDNNDYDDDYDNDDDEEDEDIDDDDSEDEDDEESDEDVFEQNKTKGKKKSGIKYKGKKTTSKSRFIPKELLLKLLMQIREQLINGDYRSLFVVWEKYCFCDDMEQYDETDENIPPKPQDLPTGKAIIEQFRQLLTTDF